MYCTVLYCVGVYLSVNLGGFSKSVLILHEKMSASPRLAATQPDMMKIIGNMIGAGLEWNLEWNGKLLWL